MPPALNVLLLNKSENNTRQTKRYLCNINFRLRHGPHHLGHAKLVRFSKVRAVRGSRCLPLPTSQASRGFAGPLLDAPLSLRPTSGPPLRLGLKCLSVSGGCSRRDRNGGGYGRWRGGMVAYEQKGPLASQHDDCVLQHSAVDYRRDFCYDFGYAPVFWDYVEDHIPT